MKTRKRTFENLVFEGGGPKGAAYAGCMDVMDNLGLLKDVKRVAGTSAGSITAALLACGSGSEGLKYTITHTNFAKFVSDSGWIFGDVYRIFKCFGFHTGDPFVKILKQAIGEYAGNSELTFRQLDEKVAHDPSKFKELTVVASNLTTQIPEVFNSKLTPDLPIWKAVRASMSIPVIFEPMKIKKNYYVDGGLSWIFPIDVYDTEIEEIDGDELYKRNPETLGFYLEAQRSYDKGKRVYNPSFMKISSLKSFALAMMDFLMENANSKHLHPDDKSRTVFIDDMGVSGTNFNVTSAEVKALIKAGTEATDAYFTKLGYTSTL